MPKARAKFASKRPFRLGVDENGLGPRLGPMIVTAVLARVTDEGWDLASRKPRGALAKRLGDSKQMVAHGDVALAEAWTRALVARGCGREPAETSSPDGIVHAVATESRATLRSPCPDHVGPQCWSVHEERFAADDDLV